MTETINGKQQDTRQRVVAVIAELAGSDPSEITPDRHLTADLQFDSLEMVELATELEDVFNLAVPDEDVDKLQTVGDVQAYIEAHADTG